MLGLKANQEGLTFSVYIQPRAAKVAVVGLYQNALKIKLTAPPVSGAANKQCIAVLAKALDMPKSQIEIVSGHTHRLKQIRLRLPDRDATPQLRKRLADRLQELAQTPQKKHLD